jgi:hypothetical protein
MTNRGILTVAPGGDGLVYELGAEDLVVEL